MREADFPLWKEDLSANTNSSDTINIILIFNAIQDDFKDLLIYNRKLFRKY